MGSESLLRHLISLTAPRIRLQDPIVYGGAYFVNYIRSSLPMIDLSSKSVRQRLSPSALLAFFNIMKRWCVPADDARRLLGGFSKGLYFGLQKRPNGRVLDPDQLLRISYLIGIYKALHIIHSQPLADRWIQLPNTNSCFGGVTPLAHMLGGGVTAMQTVESAPGRAQRRALKVPLWTRLCRAGDEFNGVSPDAFQTPRPKFNV